ncbi:MAG: CRISPR-associated protein Csx16 [Fimbriimonadales bacterium]
MIRADLIVTRHQGLVDIARRMGLATDGCPVLAHATADDVRGKVVLGVLPLHLAALAKAVVSIDLDLPADRRGTDLSAEEMLPYVRGVSVYRVIRE